jgi:ribosome production factor 1
VELLGEKAPPAKVPRTQDSTRVKMPDLVQEGDEEVIEDEANDTFAAYFKSTVRPKILITSSINRKSSGKETKPFGLDLVKVFPNSKWYDRKNISLPALLDVCRNKGITDLIILNEDRKQTNGWMHTHLPDGPTAYYRLTNCVLMENIFNNAPLLDDDYEPEVIMNNFTTRLGHSVARMINCLIPQKPDFQGRRVMTYHNQRDFIFFRHHRYMFHTEKNASIQEIGPRFTLKLEYLRRGLPDDNFAEYEWVRGKDAEARTNRLKFFL